MIKYFCDLCGEEKDKDGLFKDAYAYNSNKNKAKVLKVNKENKILVKERILFNFVLKFSPSQNECFCEDCAQNRILPEILKEFTDIQITELRNGENIKKR